MDILDKIKKTAIECGMSEAGYIDTNSIEFRKDIRQICERNACGNYGATWACPPAIGTVEECRNRIKQYNRMLLFSKIYELEDSFDFEGMMDSMQIFKDDVDLLERSIRDILEKYLMLANEGCGRCGKCTYPDAPCRFPEKLHHSLEGYGLMVSHLARAAGIHYTNGENTVTFFGALLFNKE